MAQVIWKGFTLGELFNFDSGGQLTKNKKSLDILDCPDDSHTIAVVTQSEKNNGISGYVKADTEVTSKIKNNCLSYSMHFGLCFYHDYDFVLMDTHGSVFTLVPKSSKLQEIFKSTKSVCLYFAKLITYVCHNDVYNYTWLPNSSRVAREVILLPCLEVDNVNDYIWIEGNKFYTLAIDYIKKLIKDANEYKNLKKKEAVALEEEERAFLCDKYTSDRKAYSDIYLDEKKNVKWIGFKLGSLFTRSTKLAINKNLKDLDLKNIDDENHTIALVSASRDGKGIAGYINDNCVDSKLVSTNKITFDDQWGYTCFHDEKFIITGGHNSILEINDFGFKQVLDENPNLYLCICALINKITIHSGIFGYSYKINNKFDREIILLPCIEVWDNEKYIWDVQGIHYTLATGYLNYLYLSGRIMYNKR